MFKIIAIKKSFGKRSLQIIQKAILMTITRLKSLYCDLKNKYNTSYILTSKLKQDALENLLCEIRSRSGLNDHPTLLNALCRFRMIILGKSLPQFKHGINM